MVCSKIFNEFRQIINIASHLQANKEVSAIISKTKCETYPLLTNLYVYNYTSLANVCLSLRNAEKSLDDMQGLSTKTKQSRIRKTQMDPVVCEETMFVFHLTLG